MADLVVVGGGPGGTAAAIAGASQGGEVVLVERSNLGGTCVNAGCIPSGALHHIASLYHAIGSAERLGLQVERPSVSWPDVHRSVGRVVEDTAARVRSALEFSGVEVVSAAARFTSPARLVAGDVEFADVPVVVATGAQDAPSPVPGNPSIPLLGNAAAMAVAATPARLAVLGGRRFGLEWAQLFATFGSEVTVVGGDSRILPEEDEEMAGFLQLMLEERNIRFVLGSEIEEVDGATVVVAGEQIVVDAMLVADERVPNVTKLGLDAAGVTLDTDEAIVVDLSSKTSVDGIFAAGDVTGPPWLSNRAAAQGEVAAINALGGSAKIRPERIPRSVNTVPALAAVGLTEAEAEARGIEAATGFADLAGSARAIALGDPRGGLKLVVDPEFGEILGAHMVGVGASETIAQVVAAMEAEVDFRDLTNVHHLHPTLAELVTEAAASIGA